MNPLRNCIFSLLLIVTFCSCEKEYSFESQYGVGHGSLQSDISGDCLPKTVQGAFLAGKALIDTNAIMVDIFVTSIGSYKIASDTVNGFSFEATGVFSSTGINTVKFKGKGTPGTSGTNLFVLSYDTSFCLVEVSVLPASAGVPAVFTLAGSPGSCINTTVTGTYAKDVALNSSNKLNLEVNVSNIGTYNVSTTAINGITFSANGTFASTGTQMVTLNGSGTPLATGTNPMAITGGSTNCTFPVTVSGAVTPPVTSTYFWKFTESAFVYQGEIVDTETQLVSTQHPWDH